MIQQRQHQQALGRHRGKKLNWQLPRQTHGGSAVGMSPLPELATLVSKVTHTGYLFLSDAALAFLDEQLGRSSFTGDGGKEDDGGSCL